MDTTIQIRSGLGRGTDEVAMGGLAATVSLGADPGLGAGVVDTVMANKWKILGGLAAVGAAFLGWRWYRARHMAPSASVSALAGNRNWKGHGANRRRKKKKAQK